MSSTQGVYQWCSAPLSQVIESQEAVELVCVYIKEENMTLQVRASSLPRVRTSTCSPVSGLVLLAPQQACEKLVDMALRLGSSDNVTVMIVDVRQVGCSL